MDALIELEEAEADGTVLVSISTKNGVVNVVGRLELADKVLHCHDVHIDGPGPGSLGRAMLNEICRAVMVATDVEEIVIEGGIRTTGKNPGRRPRIFRFPNS